LARAFVAQAQRQKFSGRVNNGAVEQGEKRGGARLRAALKESERRLRAAEERQRYLLALADALRGVTDPQEVQLVAARTLGRHLGADRVAYSRISVEAGVEIANTGRHFSAKGIAPVPERLPLAAFSPALLSDLRVGRITAFPDLAREPRLEPGMLAAFTAIGVAAYVAVPLVKDGRFVAVLAVHQRRPRRWTPDEVLLAQDTAERAWAAVEWAEAEDAQRKSELRYRTLFSAMNQGFCIVEKVTGTRDYRFLEANKAFERHTGLRDVVGKTVLQLMPRLDGAVLDHPDRVLATGASEELETYVPDLDAWLEAAIFRIGSPGQLGVLFSNITARKRFHQQREQLLAAANAARAEADAANLSKDEFLAMLGHELRNPLTPILATLELMRIVDDSAFVRERDVLERQARHLSRLVEDLLDATRIVRGKVNLDRKRVDVAKLIARAVESVAPLLDEKRQRLQIEVPPALLVEADATRLLQVFVNLIDNAAKYTAPGGHIAIDARAEDEQTVVVRVRDDGKGITPDLLPHVFDLFRQGPQRKDRREGGLGIGLAIVRTLVELHGGTVSAASEGAGRGSELTVRLPRAPDPRRGRGPSADRARPQAPRRGRVLIVDDNRDITQTLAAVLRKRGYEVEVAYSAMEGFEVATRFRPGVALLDIGLPDLDGYDLARKFKQAAELAGVTLIAITGYGQPDDRLRARQAGFSVHLTKPIDFKRLQAAMEKPAATARARRKRRQSA
jgi:signal transduction histidine kinase/CheY-like chemotaxis protein